MISIRILILAGLLFNLTLSGRAQGSVILNAGDTWSYQFTTLPFFGVDNLFPPIASCGAHFDLSDPSGTSVFEVRLFENDLAQNPFFVSSPGDRSGSGGAVQVWQDFQGWAQLKITQGSVILNSVQIDVRTPRDAGSVNHYQIIAPVPEPSSKILFVLGTGTLLVTGRRLTFSKQL